MALYGFQGASPSDAVAALLKRTPAPSPADLTSLFQGLPRGLWSQASTDLVTAGIPGSIIRAAMYTALKTELDWVKGALVLLSAAASGYHGARRNGSIFWGAWWFIMGMTFPVFTPVVALAQGYSRKRT